MGKREPACGGGFSFGPESFSLVLGVFWSILELRGELIGFLDHLSDAVELVVQQIQVDRSGGVEAGGLQCVVSPVIYFLEMTEELVEVDVAFSHGKDFQVGPFHVSPAVIVHVVMADMIRQPGVFRVVEQVQLAVEVRHFRIKDEMDVRIGSL